MRKSFCLLMLGLLLLSFPVGAINVTINGEYQEYEVAPLFVNERVMVPMRAIFESLNAKVEWDGQTQKITAVTPQRQVVFQIGSNAIQVNGELKEIDTPAQLLGDYTYVPVRAVSEALGYYVTWDGSNETVVISEPTIRLSSKMISVAVDETVALYVETFPKSNVSWKFDNDDLVYYSGSYDALIITGKKKGSTTLTAYSENGAIAKCAIQVGGSKKSSSAGLTPAPNDYYSGSFAPSYNGGNVTATTSALEMFNLNASSYYQKAMRAASNAIGTSAAAMGGIASSYSTALAAEAYAETMNQLLDRLSAYTSGYSESLRYSAESSFLSSAYYSQVSNFSSLWRSAYAQYIKSLQ